MTILDTFLAFEGKDVGPLRAALKAGITTDDLDFILEHCSSEKENHEIAATWLVKALAEENCSRLDETFLTILSTHLSLLRNWQSQLHILQCVQHICESPTFSKSIAQNYISFAERHLNSPKTFVRVWAMDAYVRLAAKNPQLKQQAQELLSSSRSDSTASLRARAKHLVKLYPEL